MSTEKVKVYEEQQKKGLPIWAWLLPLLLVLALAWWFFSRNHNEPATTANTSTAPVVDNTKPDQTQGSPARASTWTAVSLSDAFNKDGRVSLTDNDVHFATASANLEGDSQAVLDQVAQVMGQNSGWKMRLVGHTDSTGDKSANDVLSEQRAKSVMAYLGSHGVNAGRLRVEAEGQSKPVASNASDTGRAENRRVDLIKE